MAFPLGLGAMAAGALAEPTPLGELALIAAILSQQKNLSQLSGPQGQLLSGLSQRSTGLSQLNTVQFPGGGVLQGPTETQGSPEDFIISNPPSQEFIERLIGAMNPPPSQPTEQELNQLPGTTQVPIDTKLPGTSLDQFRPDLVVRSEREVEIVQPGKSSRRPEELSLEEINQQIKEGTKSDKDVAIEVFGKEIAKRYELLQRIANSSIRSPQELDKASEEIGKLEDTLTEKEQNKLFGIGEDIIDVDLLKELRDAIEFSRLNDESAEQLGKSLRFAVTRIGDKSDTSEMNNTELAGFVGIKEAFNIAKEKGFDLKEVSSFAIQSAASRFSDPEDAKFMLRRFLDIKQKLQ